MSNPFAVSLVRLQLPVGMGKSVSVAGFNLEADKDGCVEVPLAQAKDLEAHGLIPVPLKVKE